MLGVGKGLCSLCVYVLVLLSVRLYLTVCLRCMCVCMRGGREAEHSRAERCSAGSRTAFLSCGNFPRDKRAGKGQQKREGGRERRIDEGWDKREGGRASASKYVRE